MTAKTSHSSIRRAVHCALFAGTAAVTAMPVLAQDSTIQEVVVTGSRISTPNMTSISPVTAMAAEDIAQSGKIRVEDIINQLPQAMAAQGSMVSNGATGIATVDLRGLNAKRTLVLINGRRLQPGNPDSSPNANSGASDLNQIPRSLIERVEVLTGGASSVYGADAVAGVVNFIMNTRFEGVKVEANYSFNNHKNDNPVADIVRAKGYALPDSSVNTGYSRDFSFTMGSNFADDRGNATFYATYRDVEAVLQGQYDFSACTFNSGDTFTCGGSGTTTPSRIEVRRPDGSAMPNGSVSNYIIDSGTGALRPYNSATDAYNFGPLNFYQRPDERYTAGMFMDLDVGEGQNVYSELMFMKDRSIAQIAPSGIFGQQFSVPCDHPYLTAQQQQLFCGQFGLSSAPGTTDRGTVRIGKRNAEGGGRRSDITHESYRVVIGMRGDINDTWSYDAYGQYGQTGLSSLVAGDFSVTRIGRALDVIRDANGNPLCRSVDDGTDPACVPYNPFQLGGVTADQINYLQIPLVARGENTERIVNASVTGDLSDYGMKLPSATNGLMVNVGVEWRQERSELEPDLALLSGDGSGQGGPTTGVVGGYISKDVFAEARMPFIEDKPLAQSLSAEAGYRYSDYDLGFSTNTYKAGLEWTPIQDIRARTSFQRSVRVPNVTELYGVQSVGLDGTIDLCATNPSNPAERPGLSMEECARTGVLPSQYGFIRENSANQYNGFIGGNPDLQPEKADTFSFGLAFQPGFAPGLRMQVDYFDISIKDAIQNPNADFTLLMCARTGDPATCGRVQRDADGSLHLSNAGFIVDTFENIGEISTSGIDFDVSYDFDVGGAGRLGVSYIATLLDSLEFTPQTGVTYDCAGLYGSICGVPAPEYRHKVDTTWRTPWSGIDVTLSWRYFDAVMQDSQSSNEFLGFLGTTAGTDATDRELGSRSYIDLTGSVTLADKYTLRLGINNLFDKDPPLNGGNACPTGPCNGNTWSQMYDTLGRQIFGLVTIDF